MKSFLRSLQYLWPYRVRLGIACACVILIALLWAGGLGAMLPGAKILLSEEGLHGWAWNTMLQDRLAVRIVHRDMQGVSGFPPTVLDVVRVEKGGAAEKANIGPNQWLVGIGDEQSVPAKVLARRLALSGSGEKVTLWVFDRESGRPRRVDVEMGELGLGARVLGWVAGKFEEPEDLPGRFPMLLWLLGFGVVITVLRDVLRFVQEYLVETTVWRATMDLRCDMYGVVLRLPTTFFSQQGVTDTMSRFVQDTAELAHGHTTLFGKTLVEPAKAIGSIAIAMLISWKLTLLAMVAGPPAFWLIRRLGKVMRRASRRALESGAAMLGILEETLVGIRVVKSYTMEGAERRRFFGVNRRLWKQQRRMTRIEAATAPSVEALGVVAAMAAMAVAGYWVLNPQYGMSRDDFIALMACLAAMFDPVRKLAKVGTRFQRSDAAATRIFETIDRPREKVVTGAPPLGRHHESIELRGVRFRYPGAAEDALRGIDLTVRAGETLAIVGPNGCGKTTLVSLVPRLLDPTEGTVRIDGKDVSQCSLRSLRAQVGLVTQDSVLFQATIRENIAYGRRRAKDEEVLAAAKKAFVDEFVGDSERMPDGYETMVGQHGATLSGGQRQRICIARAILRDPAILIFDEAMSQVDAESERRIHQAMAEFVKGRTTLMIAHRFATVLSADRLAVMDEGRIIDVGKHAELLERCELYRHLYETQFADTGG